VQFKIFSQIVSLIVHRKTVPTFSLVHRLLTDPETLAAWLYGAPEDLERSLRAFLELPARDREEKTSGLEANLIPFVQGPLAQLVNCDGSQINLDTALEKNHILYFQLPTMYSAIAGATMGRLILQCLQASIAKRHLGLLKSERIFAVYLDDFQDFIYPEFAAILNKAREAKISVLFSHQALGDLDKVSPAFRNIVQTCTNVKIVMRMNDPDSCEHMARTIGTSYINEHALRKQMAKAKNLDPKRLKQFKVPDAAFLLKTLQRPFRVALELEITPKSTRRYHEAIKRLAINANYDVVFFIAATEKVLISIQQTLAKLRETDPVVKASPHQTGFHYALLSDVLANGLSATFKGPTSSFSFESLQSQFLEASV
jgi:hypothetical protein